MKIVTAEEMRKIDERAIKGYGIPALVLMENAGLGVVRAMEEEFGPLSNKVIFVFAGKGNNGGDGFVVARHLANQGASVCIFLLAKKEEIRGEAKTNLEIVLKMGLDLKEVISIDELKVMQAKVKNADFIVDAILGTGISGSVTGFLAEVIDFLNNLGQPIVAIDIPSGLNADTGQAQGAVIRAALTVTMGLPKRGLILYPGANYTGKLKVADIGFPRELLTDKGIRVNLITKEEVSQLFPPREPNTHKGSYGLVLILAGSVGYTGAASLTSLGALKSGAGLVILGLPKSLNEIMEVKVTEVITKPLPETVERALSLEAYDLIEELAQRADVLAIGPGIGTYPQIGQLIRQIITSLDKPMVIDADGINALVGNLAILKRKRAPLILTPHPGEMARLVSKSKEEVQADRIGWATRFAEEYELILVLKGARTVVASPAGEVFINPTGNPGMATAGSGDVLTGMIASFLGQRLEPLEAAKAGVYLHGLAGDLATKARGEEGVIAGDILEMVPEAIKAVAKK